MDRTRVLCPSISVVAHAAGAAILVLAPLVLPSTSPAPRGVRPVFVPQSLSVNVGGGAGGGSRGARPSPRPPRIAAPAFVAPIVPEATLDLGGGAFIPGLPDGESGGGGGLCLSGCDPAPAAPTVEPMPAPEPAPPARVRVGGHVREPRKTRHVAPVYPPLALAARVQGSVRLECVIGEDGRISDIAVVQGHPLLDAAAIEAVRQWRYLPTLLNGVRVSVVLTVVVDFRLR
jgi:TonB family protein